MRRVNRHYEKSFIRLVQDERQADIFFQHFYQNFMAESPAVRHKFRNTDWKRQITLLKNMVLYLQRYYETGQANERLQAIATSHSRTGYDITSELYDQWLHAFLKTLRECDPKWSKKVESGWVEVLTPGIDYMRSHY